MHLSPTSKLGYLSFKQKTGTEVVRALKKYLLHNNLSIYKLTEARNFIMLVCEHFLLKGTLLYFLHTMKLKPPW